MAYAFQAIDPSGRAVEDTIQAGSLDEAVRLLRSKGMLVTRLSESRPDDLQAQQQSVRRRAGSRGRSIRWKDIVYFTQQMAMLLGSGARMVPALTAVESQCHNESMRAVIGQLRDRVEDGVALHAAMADRPDVFNGVFTSLVAAGEAMGRIAESFDKLAAYTRQQQEIRQRIVGVITYPAVLVVMSIGILIGLFSFVLPRFHDLFTTLDVPLPSTTQAMISLSYIVGSHWIALLTTLIGSVATVIILFRSDAGQRWWLSVYTQIPLVGHIIRSIIMARIFRVWGILIANNVGVIDALRMTRGTTRSTIFRKMLDDVENAVVDGRLIGATLQESKIVPTTLAAAVATGEESGRLGASMLFIADNLDSDNAQLLGSLSRIIEPVILIVLGAVVGVVAISLFMPLFDIATIAGGG